MDIVGSSNILFLFKLEAIICTVCNGVPSSKEIQQPSGKTLRILFATCAVISFSKYTERTACIPLAAATPTFNGSSAEIPRKILAGNMLARVAAFSSEVSKAGTNIAPGHKLLITISVDETFKSSPISIPEKPGTLAAKAERYSVDTSLVLSFIYTNMVFSHIKKSIIVHCVIILSKRYICAQIT